MKSLSFLFLATISSSSTALKKAQHEFADQITPALYGKENDCSSALGISMAMSLLYPSMIETNQNQLKHVFGYDKETSNELQWDTTQQSLTTKYTGKCRNADETPEKCTSSREPWIIIQNSVWAQETLTLESYYETVIGEYLRTMDFESPDAGATINEWVKESTQGLIEGLVRDGSLKPWVMLVMNTIYLKANWQHSFDSAFTTKDPFYGGVGEANFMHQVTKLPHWYSGEHQVIEMPFSPKFSGLSMYISLGKDPDNMLTSTSLVKAIQSETSFTSDRRVAVALPKFQFLSTYEGDDLMNALKNLGVTKPFDGGLCIYTDAIGGPCSQLIEYMIQKTYIGIDEDGVEAAAVTAISVGTTSFQPPPTDEPLLFMANQPFQFFIYDKDEDVMLFEGMVRNPGTVGDDDVNVMPLVGGVSHNDVDYWKNNFPGPNPVKVLEGGPGSGAYYYSRMLSIVAVVGLWMIL
mmetsp:Transcript_16357/g.24754  ORF Transcript_16357/g.24754 Transcript_16357/m.24754 type:complete len:465 (-) Transcript_16357:168-1562(-)